MTRTMETTVYKFDELSERAKERARDWFRRDYPDYGWWEFTYEDASQCATILGIDLNQKPVKLMNGSTRYDPCIWFSGFCMQGDGARFEGTYQYVKGAAKVIREHAPQDNTLHDIADTLQAIQRKYFYRVRAKIGRSPYGGNYEHSHCMLVDAYTCGENLYDGEIARVDEEALTDAMRSFADWIYKQLETEYEYMVSDEQVDESMRCNEYEFDEHGSIA